MDFGQHYGNIARPFEWTLTRHKLDQILAKITAQLQPLAPAA